MQNKLVFKTNYIISFCIFSLFALLSISGVFYPARYNFLPVNPMLEISLLLLAIINFKNINKKIILFTLLTIFYILITAALAIYREINIFDYLMAYKSFIYIIILSFFVGKDMFDLNFISNFFKMLSIFFFIKYLYMNVLFLDDRPGLFTENNFELMLLVTMFYLKAILSGRVNFFDIIVVFSVFILSGSRSGIVIFAFVLLMIYSSKLDIKTIFRFIFLFLVIFVVYLIFLERSGGFIDISKIDRFNFLMNFISDISGWNFVNYLIGTEVLTPMSSQTCQNLSYYSSLFSYNDDGTCYSVILHSYILRAIYDHGILGLVFVFCFYYKALRVSGYKLLQTLTFIGIPILNSLSVSAFNSIYFIFAILIVLSTKKGKN